MFHSRGSFYNFPQVEYISMKNCAPIASASIFSEFTEIKVWLGAIAVKKRPSLFPKANAERRVKTDAIQRAKTLPESITQNTGTARAEST